MLEHAKSEYVRANRERAANKSKKTATSSTASELITKIKRRFISVALSSQSPALFIR